MSSTRSVALVVMLFGLVAGSVGGVQAQQLTCQTFAQLPEAPSGAYVRGLVDGYQYAVAQIDASRESLQPPDDQADNPIREAMFQYGKNLLRDMATTMDLGALDLTYDEIARRMSAVCEEEAGASRSILAVFWEAVGQVREATEDTTARNGSDAGSGEPPR